MNKQKPRWTNFIGIGAALITIAIVMVVTKVNVSFADDSVRISGDFMSSSTVTYSTITDIELRDSFSTGSRSMGASTFQIYSGQFNNSEFGRYKLFAYKKVPSFIIIHTTEGITVVNAPSVEETKALYTDLCSRAGINA